MALPTLADVVIPPPAPKRGRKRAARAPVRWWRRKRVQALAVIAGGALLASLCAVYGRCDVAEPGWACHVCNVLRPVARFLALGLGV